MSLMRGNRSSHWPRTKLDKGDAAGRLPQRDAQVEPLKLLAGVVQVLRRHELCDARVQRCCHHIGQPRSLLRPRQRSRVLVRVPRARLKKQ